MVYVWQVKDRNLDLIRDFPNLKFWAVGAEKWNDKFKVERRYPVPTRLFCTLENSLSLRIVGEYIKPGYDFEFIDFASKYFESDRAITSTFICQGIAFAETGKVYRYKNLNQLKEDYLIAMLSDLKQ